jgi:polysaccharide biosynthesis/export protein
MKPSIPSGSILPRTLRAVWTAGSLLALFHAFPLAAGAQCQDGAENRIFPGDVLQISAFRKQVAIEEYRIRVFDKINIVFPTAPQFSSEQTVTPDGKVHLPRGVQVSVAGLPMDQAKDSVRKQFEAQGWTPEFYLMFSDFGASNGDLLAFFADNGNKGRPVAVGPDGYLHLPFLSELAVAGQSIPEANAGLNREYGKLFPQLDFYIDMKKAEGHRAFIFGQVRQAGAYDASQNLTALNMLSMAGGALPGADLGRVIILTPENRTMKGRKLDLKAILSGKGDKADALLCPGTIVYVPKGSLASAAEFMRTLGDVIFFRGFIAGFNWDVGRMFGE